MIKCSRHHITMPAREGEPAIDITYSYCSQSDPPVLTLIDAIAQDALWDGLPEYIKGTAQDWLDGEGYDRACQLAEEKCHGNEE